MAPEMRASAQKDGDRETLPGQLRKPEGPGGESPGDRGEGGSKSTTEEATTPDVPEKRERRAACD